MVPPEAMTLGFDELIAGAKKDRYASRSHSLHYATLFNDPNLSKTGGAGLRHAGHPSKNRNAASSTASSGDIEIFQVPDGPGVRSQWLPSKRGSLMEGGK